MSATIDGARVAAVLADASGAPAPVVASEGRAHPVEVRWAARRPDAARGAAEAAAAATVRAALAEHPGDALVFLPGAAEIRRTAELLGAGPLPGGARVRELHGALDAAEQDAAVAPSPPGTRKVVLATSIAETSLTIEGVRVVVDAGLARVPRFSPRTGMTHLDTVRVSRAAAAQRAGRAGRVAPGVCYRLWPEAEHHGLLPHATPEILEADLAPLALELAAAGVADPAALRWTDPPPEAAYARARALLAQLGALDADGRVTAHGRRMAALPLHPRLAHMLLRAAELDEAAGPPLGAGRGPAGGGALRLAGELAALLGERDLLRPSGPGAHPDADLRLRLPLLRGPAVPAAVHGWPVDRAGVHRARQEARALADRVRAAVRPAGRGAPSARRPADADARGPSAAAPAGPPNVDADALAGVLVALAYPDRVARRRAAGGSAEGGPAPGRFVLRNGRGAVLAAGQPLGVEPFLAVAELAGAAGERESRIALAAPVDLADLDAHFADQIERGDEVAWDDAAGAVRARRVERLGALVLRERAAPSTDPALAAAALLGAVRDAVRARGLDAGAPLERRRARPARARRLPPRARRRAGADVGHQHRRSVARLVRRGARHRARRLARPVASRAATLGRRRGARPRRVLAARLTWAQRAALDALAPTHVTVPTGSRVRVDYADPAAPVLAVRLQELFGVADTPRIAGGRVALTLHLLSPAHRPVQVTRDLAGFWRSSYFDVRRDLRGRYPRHPWPDDPLAAEPTRRAKPRG
jgi:ATP-dependent helicase HrpB